MADKDDKEKKDVFESFRQMMEEFGNAVGEVFRDPDLKQKAKEFGNSAKDSAKAFADRFKDEDVKNQFKEVGKAAKKFGKSMKVLNHHITNAKNAMDNVAGEYGQLASQIDNVKLLK